MKYLGKYGYFKILWFQTRLKRLTQVNGAGLKTYFLATGCKFGNGLSAGKVPGNLVYMHEFAAQALKLEQARSFSFSCIIFILMAMRCMRNCYQRGRHLIKPATKYFFIFTKLFPDILMITT